MPSFRRCLAARLQTFQRPLRSLRSRHSHFDPDIDTTTLAVRLNFWYCFQVRDSDPTERPEFPRRPAGSLHGRLSPHSRSAHRHRLQQPQAIPLPTLRHAATAHPSRAATRQLSQVPISHQPPGISKLLHILRTPPKACPSLSYTPSFCAESGMRVGHKRCSCLSCTVFQRLLGPGEYALIRATWKVDRAWLCFPPPYRVAPVKESGLVHSQRALSPSST